MRPFLPASVAAGALALVAGCTEAQVSPPPQASVRDSAGVLISDIGDPYSYRAPVAELRETWVSAEDALLSRVVGGVLLGDGRAAVVDQGNTEILVFDRDGSVLRKVGRVGDGPGEYRRISSIHRFEDELWIHDAGHARWTRLDADLNLIGTRPSGLESYIVDLKPLTIGPNGTVTAILGDMRRFGTDGVSRDTMPLMSFDSAGFPDTLGLWANQEWSYQRSDAGVSRVPVGYGRTTVSASSERWFALGDNATDRVTVFGSEGRPVRSVRIDASQVTIGPSEKELYAAEREAAISDAASDLYRERLSDAPINDTYPAYEAVAIAGDGSVWIGLTARVGDRSRRWLKVSAAGQIEFEFELPPKTEVLAMTNDAVLVKELDQFDVPVVRRLEFERPAAES